jgi:hypothetical protein
MAVGASGFAAIKRDQPCNSWRLAMTKLMMVVVVCMSGALYNPSRVLHYIGPDAAAFCWTLKNTLGLR